VLNKHELIRSVHFKPKQTIILHYKIFNLPVAGLCVDCTSNAPVSLRLGTSNRNCAKHFEHIAQQSIRKIACPKTHSRHCSSFKWAFNPWRIVQIENANSCFVVADLDEKLNIMHYSKPVKKLTCSSFPINNGCLAIFCEINFIAAFICAVFKFWPLLRGSIKSMR